MLPICYLSVLVLFLLDTTTMQQGVRDGIELCLITVIPALFPFLLLSSPLMEQLRNSSIPLSSGISRLLRISQNSVPLFLIGLLGGYPVGARCIAQDVKTGKLSPADGNRMLCFCTNAGPSFIFGMGISLFADGMICCLAWMIQILSAVLMGIMTPGSCKLQRVSNSKDTSATTDTLFKAMETMGMICGWVVIFRIIICYCKQYLFRFVPQMVGDILLGLLELSNGCYSLQEMADLQTSWLLFSLYLALGGGCVALQTASILRTVHLSVASYLRAKFCQGILALSLAGALCPYPIAGRWIWLLPIGALICGRIFILPKISTGKRERVGV